MQKRVQIAQIYTKKKESGSIQNRVLSKVLPVERAIEPVQVEMQVCIYMPGHGRQSPKSL